MPVHTIHCAECSFTFLFNLGGTSRTNSTEFVHACKHRESLKSLEALACPALRHQIERELNVSFGGTYD
jgi:hypothetical protein